MAVERPLGFKERAIAFTSDVSSLIEQTKKTNPLPLFDINVEDALGDFRDGLAKLDQVLQQHGDGELNSTDSFLSPGKQAQKIDEQSKKESVVRIYGQAESEEMLVDFIAKVRKLAETHGAKPSNFMSLLQSTDHDNGVEYLGFEGEGLLRTHLNFSFTG